MITQDILRTNEEKYVVSYQTKIRFVTVLDLIKCLKHIKEKLLLLACTLNSKLPSDISTMLQPLLSKISFRLNAKSHKCHI